jgi:hypothetical protein
MNGKVVPKSSLNGISLGSTSGSFMNSGSQYMNNHGQSLSRGTGQFKYDPKLSVAFFGFGYFLSFCGDTAYKQIKKYIQGVKK